MKKGFTLIELLAVIVILAIIAVISVPIVLNIIDEVKSNSTLRSAEMYVRAAELSIAQATLNDKNISDGTYNLIDGDICLKYTNTACAEELVVEVNGEIPKKGTVVIAKGNISSIVLDLNDKTVSKTGNNDFIYPCKKVNGDKNQEGSKFECEVSPGVKYNFYVLSQEDDGTTNLIMDRNMCSDGTPTDSKKEDKCYVAWNSSGTITEGPITAMEYLNSATNTWSNIPNFNMIYDDSYGSKDYTNFAINGKARMPKINEIDDYSTNNNKGYLFNNLHADCKDSNNNTVSCEIATQKYGIFEEGIEHIIDIHGYLTIDALRDTFDSSFKNTIIVHSSGVNGYIDINNSNFVGVRPVINLKL